MSQIASEVLEGDELNKFNAQFDGEPVNEQLYKGRLLNHHYIRRAESSIGVGVRYLMDKAYFGTSNLVEKDPAGGWKIQDIPLDFKLEDMLTNFDEAQLLCQIKEDTSTILIAVHYNDQGASDGERNDFNTLVMVDAENKPFAVLCLQQETLYKGRTFSAFATIEQKVA